jgi:hypothetical protein
MKATVCRGVARVLDIWLGAIDPVRLKTFRLLMGVSLLVYLSARWPRATEWLTQEGFHVSAGIFQHQPFALPLLSPAVLPWFGMLGFGSAVALILGWQARWAAAVALGWMTYVTFADVLMVFTINKLFLISLAVLILAPPESYWSVGQIKGRLQSAWALRVLQVTMTIHYFGAGWCKVTHGDWLENPYVLWSQVQGVYRTDVASWLLRHLPLGVWSWMQYVALTYELSVPLLFLVRRLRLVGLLWTVGFHLFISLTMYELIYFSLQLLTFLVLFVEDRTLHAIRTQLAQVCFKTTGCMTSR